MTHEDLKAKRVHAISEAIERKGPAELVRVARIDPAGPANFARDLQKAIGSDRSPDA